MTLQRSQYSKSFSHFSDLRSLWLIFKIVRRLVLMILAVFSVLLQSRFLEVLTLTLRSA